MAASLEALSWAMEASRGRLLPPKHRAALRALVELGGEAALPDVARAAKMSASEAYAALRKAGGVEMERGEQGNTWRVVALPARVSPERSFLKSFAGHAFGWRDVQAVFGESYGVTRQRLRRWYEQGYTFPRRGKPVTTCRLVAKGTGVVVEESRC